MSEQTVWGWDSTGPVWGARAYEPRRGQDHLGLASVSSDHILPRLSPGINVLTYHPRYWSFYSWVLSSFWDRELPRSKPSFRAFYRPREALYAAACLSCDLAEHETLVGTIVGAQKVKGKLGETGYDPQFEYIKEPLGGYGLYYRSTMEAMGALVVAGRDNAFPWDAPTPVGRALAFAFEQAVKATTIGQRLTRDDVETPATGEELREFARQACLCQLSTATDRDDLPLLQDLFLHGGRTDEAVARRQSLRFLLDLSGCRQEAGIDEDEFRQLVYFRRLDDESYEPHSELATTARRWRIYQGREYFSFAFNRMFGWLVRTGLDESSQGLAPVPITWLWELVDEALDQSPSLVEGGELFSSSTRVSALWTMLLREVDAEPGPDEVWPRDGLLDEHVLYEFCLGEETDPAALLSSAALLILLYERFGTAGRQAALTEDQDFLAEGTAKRIGMTGFFNAFHRKLAADVTLGDLLRWLLRDYVIVQHERVATTKLREGDTFRFYRAGEHMRFFERDAGAGFGNSRFEALSATVHELGFVTSLRWPNREISAAGSTLLETGDLPSGALAAAVQGLESSGGDVDGAP